MTAPSPVMSGKFLVVDDSAFDRARLSAVVKSLGCEAVEVAYADQVLEVARKEQPMMILMDVVMGPPNGFEVCRTLREHPDTKHIPVVLCSVKSTKVDHDWARRQGAMGYLAKPIDHDKTRDFLAKQWSKFQEASAMSRQRDDKKQQLNEMVEETSRAQREMQEKIGETRTSPRPVLGWKELEAARAAGSGQSLPKSDEGSQ